MEMYLVCGAEGAEDVRDAGKREGDAREDEVCHEEEEVPLIVKADALVYPCATQRQHGELEEIRTLVENERMDGDED
jgi:hypothetical protein